jgi:hypothetical protein
MNRKSNIFTDQKNESVFFMSPGLSQELKDVNHLPGDNVFYKGESCPNS